MDEHVMFAYLWRISVGLVVLAMSNTVRSSVLIEVNATNGNSKRFVISSEIQFYLDLSLNQDSK